MPNCKKAILSTHSRAEGIDKFMIFLEQFGLIPLDVREFLLANLTVEVHKKKTVFWPRGLPSEYIYFVCKGVVRSTYLLPNGLEATNWLFGSGEIAAIPSSLFTKSISYEDLRTVSDAVIIKISYDLLSHNFQRFAYLNIVRVAIMERYILHYQAQNHMLRNFNFQERLDEFQKSYPYLYRCVPLEIVASYLAMSKTSIIRLRQYKMAQLA